tara:strand:+ start:209 stop:1198 length:990 start_codon:yes stop_codon:yes gene_type:complete
MNSVFFDLVLYLVLYFIGLNLKNNINIDRSMPILGFLMCLLWANASLADLEQSAQKETVKKETAQNKTAPRGLALGVSHRSYAFASFEDTKAKFAMDSTLLKLPLGKFDLGRSFFVPELAMRKTAFRFDNVDANNQEVYTLKAQLMVVTPTDDQWTRIIQVTPSLHTDLDAIDEDAFSLMGLAIWRFKSTDISTWTMGVGFSRLFGTYKPIPLLSYQYKIDQHIQLDVGFPMTKAEYRWQTDWSVYSSIAPVGGNWRYESQENERLNISYSSWIAATGIRYQIKPKLWATIEVGQSFARTLNLDADNQQNQDVGISDSPVIMMSFGFHP